MYKWLAVSVLCLFTLATLLASSPPARGSSNQYPSFYFKPAVYDKSQVADDEENMSISRRLSSYDDDDIDDDDVDRDDVDKGDVDHEVEDEADTGGSGWWSW